MSTLKVNNIQDATGNNAISIDSSGNVTLAAGFVPQTAMGRRNLIINGAMQVAQRGTSFAATSTSSEVYTIDRFLYRVSQASKITISQDSSVVPAGYKNSLKVYVDAGYTATSSDYFDIRQPIEGQDIAQLAFGTSDAVNITVSFWVRSNVTGTFGGSIFNGSSYNYSYPFEYSISSANTWERKTITIPGATAGTWGISTTAGLTLSLSLGGTNFAGTAGAWTGAFKTTTSGATSMLGTTGNTFYLTGVQLEVGSVATPFEHRSYGEELALCQRYYKKYTQIIETAGRVKNGSTGIHLQLNPIMRADPTATQSASSNVYYGNGSYSVTAMTVYAEGRVTFTHATVSGTTVGDSGAVYIYGGLELDAEL